MKLHLFLATFLFSNLLSGCAGLVVENPTIDDLAGKWESTSIGAYSTIQILSSQKGVLAIVRSESDISTYQLTSFSPTKNSTKITFTAVKDNDKPVVVKAKLVLGNLLISDESNPQEIIWYIRPERLSKFQAMADDAIKKVQKPKN